jgi:hypothetical protein
MMMRTWRLVLVFVLALVWTGAGAQAAKEGKQKSTDDKVKVKQTPPTKQVVKPKRTTTVKRAPKVDTFIDKNNDGVNDRRERKVVRPSKLKPSRVSPTTVPRSQAKPKARPPARPKAKPKTAEKQPPRR